MIRRLVSTARTLGGQPHFTGLLCSSLALGMAYSFYLPFISTWGTTEVGMSPTTFSIFMTALYTSAMIAGTLLGRLSDTRVARRRVLILGACGGMLSYAGFAFLREVWVLGLVGCTLQAVATACFSQLFAHVREEYQSADVTRQAMTMSVLRASFSFAWMVGPALGSLVLVAWRFEGLFTAAAFLWALFLLGVLRFVPYRARPQMAPGSRTDSVWRTFRRRDILLSFLAFCAVLATVSLNLMNLPLAIIHTLGGNERDFGIVFGIGPVVEVPMMLWFSLLASRGYQLSLIRLGFLLALLYFCGLFLAREVWHVYLLQIVSGTMIAILTNISIVFFQDLLPGQPGLATALYSNAQAVGSLFGVLSFGFIVDSFGHRGVFMTCAGMTFLGLLLIMRYRKAAVA